MASLPYTKRQLIQRIRKHVSDRRQTGDDFTASDNEISLLIDQFGATKIIVNAYAAAKIEGTLSIPEAYLKTFNVGTLSKDQATGEWYAALPQPPLSLPLGYSVTRAYFSDNTNSTSQEVNFIRAKRVGYRKNMPYPSGMSGRIENNTIRVTSNNGMSLNGMSLYVQMPTARTISVDEIMNMPEDDIDFIFSSVVKSLLQRYSIPQDIVEDGLPSGRKDS